MEDRSSILRQRFCAIRGIMYKDSRVTYFINVVDKRTGESICWLEYRRVAEWKRACSLYDKLNGVSVV